MPNLSLDKKQRLIKNLKEISLKLRPSQTKIVLLIQELDHLVFQVYHYKIMKAEMKYHLLKIC